MQTINYFYSPNYKTLTTYLTGILNKYNKPPVILCIGNSRVFADSVGPAVGHLLKNKYNIKTHVYGETLNPITYSKLSFFVDYINKTHKNQKLLVIDSSLGIFSQIGSITVKESGLLSGSLQGSPIKVGDLSISCITLENQLRGKLMLAGLKKQIINNISLSVAKVIADAFSISF